MPTLENMNINDPGAEDCDVQHAPMEVTTFDVHSSPKVKRSSRKAGDIEPTPDRADGANNGEETNHVTPGTEGPKSSWENKDPKRTEVQTLNAFFKRLDKTKQANSQRNTVAQVLAKRTTSGKRLLPSGLRAETRKERAEQSRKEANEADEGETTNKTISFGTGDGNSKPAPPRGSALRRGPREKIKTFKHELVVHMKIKTSYKRKKNKVRKQVYNCLGGTSEFIWETLLEGKSEVSFLGKEGRKSKTKPIRTTADFPTTAFALTQKYAFVFNKFAFSEGRQGNTKTVDMCMIRGMDEEIEPMLEEWRVDLEERGVIIRKKSLAKKSTPLTDSWCWDHQQVCRRPWWRDNSRKCLLRGKTE